MSEKDELTKLIEDFENSVVIKDRKYMLSTYEQCFVGSEAVDVIMKLAQVPRDEAVALGVEMYKQNVFEHVAQDHGFKDGKYFYHFKTDDKVVASVFGKHATLLKGSSLPPFSGHDFTEMSPKMLEALDFLDLKPADVYNNKLLQNCHPSDYKDPAPKPKYHMVVIGGGTAGLVTAIASAGVGAKVALIEKHLTGGDCLNFGCVPSKALLRCAHAIYDIKNSEEFGVTVEGTIKVDFGKIMERMRKLRSDISDNDSVKRYSELGVDVYVGTGSFLDDSSIQVNGSVLKFARACIATGARPGVPGIKGIENVKYLTNYTVFNLTELPKRMGIIGTGAIGCEMGQAFRRFGSEVTIFGRSGNILGAEEQEAKDIITKQFQKEGIALELQARYKEIKQDETGVITLTMENGDTFEFDELLVAAGRIPNVENLNLEKASVKYNPKDGVIVNDYLQTSNKKIYAAGDICFKYKFTHVADFLARTVVRNALFFGTMKASNLLVPWGIYTDPEVAHVGLYEKDAIASFGKINTYTQNFDEVDRAILDGQTEGFVKVITKDGDSAIQGATIVAAKAGDMISEITVAMSANFNLQSLSQVIHPYPTQAESIRKIGDQYNRTRLTPTTRTLLSKVISLNR